MCLHVTLNMCILYAMQLHLYTFVFVYAAYVQVYANVCVLYEHALPLSTALWSNHHKGLPVLSGEPWGETV